MYRPFRDLVKVMVLKRAIKRASAQCKGNEFISVQGVKYCPLTNRARGPYWGILATTSGQYSPVRLKQARLVSCLLDGTRLLIVKCISGGLHLKGFCGDVFLMTRATQTKVSYYKFETTNSLNVKSS